MTLTLGMVTCDTPDPLALATWWAGHTGSTVDDAYGGEFVVLRGGALPVMLAFQREAAPAPGKNRLHLDLSAPDLDTAVVGLVDDGATEVARHGNEDFRWVVLTDPAGNEFCVSSAAHAASVSD